MTEAELELLEAYVRAVVAVALAEREVGEDGHTGPAPLWLRDEMARARAALLTPNSTPNPGRDET